MSELYGGAYYATQLEYRAEYIQNAGPEYRLETGSPVGPITQAIAATPNDHPNYIGRLNNLGNKFKSWYKWIRAIANLDNTSIYF